MKIFSLFLVLVFSSTVASAENYDYFWADNQGKDKHGIVNVTLYKGELDRQRDYMKLDDQIHVWRIMPDGRGFLFVSILLSNGRYIFPMAHLFAPQAGQSHTFGLFSNSLEHPELLYTYTKEGFILSGANLRAFPVNKQCKLSGEIEGPNGGKMLFVNGVTKNKATIYTKEDWAKVRAMPKGELRSGIEAMMISFEASAGNIMQDFVDSAIAKAEAKVAIYWQVSVDNDWSPAENPQELMLVRDTETGEITNLWSYGQ
ncbi:hypothetical protein RsTz2092_03550 [Deferribacterales bacterium RsTz2092]|nr:hypothetical protein AGMMS49941_03690 [Deferribacterales bacterium]GHU84940.1 hypothetical protein AGMMS49941_03780 [Deferribacterales bacterium]